MFEESEKVNELLLLSVVVASVSFTVAEARLFSPARRWFQAKAPLLGELLSCGYCLSHWVALILVVVFRPRPTVSWWLLDYFFAVLILAWIGSFQWAMMCWLLDKAGK